ncbi:hypothetical protein GOBAR_DD29126 [Gossypium barbadense]|nr:hypothetical protein GOBAR_DD29126 [Gossypium barbadense]
MFNIWCLHIPVQDRTQFNELVKLEERTIRSENYRTPNKPIYLVAESLGACLAISVAARNPDMDLVLVLSNPGNPLRMVMDNIVKRGLLPQTIGELSQEIATMSMYLPVLADI